MQLRQGASLIMVLLAISFVSLFCATLWRTTLYDQEITLLRAQASQNLWASEGLLNIGIALAKENYDLIIEKGQAVEIPIDSWHCNPTKKFSGLIKLAPSQDQVVVIAQLKSNSNHVQSIQCFVAQKFDNKTDKRFFVIENWQLL